MLIFSVLKILYVFVVAKKQLLHTQEGISCVMLKVLAEYIIY